MDEPDLSLEPYDLLMTPAQVGPAADTAAETQGPALRVLVTGATGYVGSRLIPCLLEAGHTVLAASRSRSGTEDYPWGSEVETREFDIEDDDLVARAVAGVDAVIYLVHSMESEDFERKDREAAQRMASACEQRELPGSSISPDWFPTGSSLHTCVRGKRWNRSFWMPGYRRLYCVPPWSSAPAPRPMNC